MRDLLVVVLQMSPTRVEACLAEVDRPGEVLREASVDRTAELAADTTAVLTRLAAGGLGSRLLALAVAVGPDVDPDEAGALLHALGAELPPGWGLPAALPVVPGSAERWTEAGAPAPVRPLVAGATVAAARSVGAHAHLPRRD